MEWAELRESIENTLDIEENNTPIRSILIKYSVSVFFLGFIAGIWYAIILYIPLFILSVFFFIILFTGLNIGTSLIVSILISWSIIYYLLLKSKFSIEEELPQKKTHQEVEFSGRALSILASKEEPIICPACRSYISANSTTCQVCNEKIISDYH